jgi:C4-dicarboxylate-binding protein DctP
MLAPSVSKFGPLGAREFEISTAVSFDSYDDLHKVTDGPVGRHCSSSSRRAS